MTLTDFSTVLAHFAQVDPAIHAQLKTVKLSDWFKERPSEYFTSIARSIIYQQLAGKAAATIYSRFEKLLQEKIEPATVNKLEEQELREVGLSWAKARYVKDLAAKVLAGEVTLTNLHELSNDEVIAELTKVKGIGPWTAEMFLIFTLQREDVFSYGDLGLRNGFASLYQIDDPTDEQIGQVISAWSPYESYGAIALWHHLDNTKS